MAKQTRSSLKNLISSHVSPKGDAGIGAAPRPKAGKAADGKPITKYLQTRINVEGWQALKHLSVEENKRLQALFVEALNDLLRKYSKAPIVEGPGDEED